MAANVRRSASFSSKAAMACPRACVSVGGSCSNTITWTRKGASVWDSGAASSHSR
jgi:hypothetical protein